MPDGHDASGGILRYREPAKRGRRDGRGGRPRAEGTRPGGRGRGGLRDGVRGGVAGPHTGVKRVPSFFKYGVNKFYGVVPPVFKYKRNKSSSCSICRLIVFSSSLKHSSSISPICRMNATFRPMIKSNASSVETEPKIKPCDCAFSNSCSMKCLICEA